MALLSVRDLHVSYGAIKAVRGISFDIERGEIVTLIGANGAGKSTTLNTIAGLIKPDSGSIELSGESIVGVRPHRIVEGRRVFTRMSVAENLDMGGYTRTDAENAETIKVVYERFPRLRERVGQSAGTMSGGEQQMLAMGRALMSKPDLLMLDEPSMGLAPILVQEIFDIIKELNRQGTTSRTRTWRSASRTAATSSRSAAPSRAARAPSSSTTTTSGRPISAASTRTPVLDTFFSHCMTLPAQPRNYRGCAGSSLAFLLVLSSVPSAAEKMRPVD